MQEVFRIRYKIDFEATYPRDEELEKLADKIFRKSRKRPALANSSCVDTRMSGGVHLLHC